MIRISKREWIQNRFETYPKRYLPPEMRPEISQYFTWCRQDETWYIPLEKMRPSPLYGSGWQLFPGSVYDFEHAPSKKEPRGCLPLVFLDDRETSVRIDGRSLSSIQELYPWRVKLYSEIDDSGDPTLRDNMWWGLEPRCQLPSYLIRLRLYELTLKIKDPYPKTTYGLSWVAIVMAVQRTDVALERRWG